MAEDKELQVREKQQVVTKAEDTRPGPQYLPPVDIYETADALTLIADMPGVGKDDVEVHLDEDELTIRGRVSPDTEGERMLWSEYDVGNYLRTFTLSGVIDRSKIEATMKNGVLTLVLPKVEEAKPRQITVKGG